MSSTALILADWVNLLFKIDGHLQRTGPKRFFSNPDKDSQKFKESVGLVFFLTALKIDTGWDWFVDPVKEEFPDFRLIAFPDDGIAFMQVEHVEIPVHCTSFDQMMSIVKGKIENHYGATQSELLIYINNAQSPKWQEQLKTGLSHLGSFKAVWSLRLIGNMNNTIAQGCVVDRLFSNPEKRIETSFDDKRLYKAQPLPSFVEQQVIDGRTYRRVKPEIMRDLQIQMRKRL